jgi:Beta-lactamase
MRSRPRSAATSTWPSLARALFDRIGMRNTLAGVDRFGDYVLSSQVFTNARDLARFGMLYLNGGKWPRPDGETILPASWIEFSRTPAPATAASGRFYGARWWLVPDDRKDIPRDAYATAGNRGQYAIVVPYHELVIVRRGLDWLPGQHAFPRWDLTREVLKAFPAPASMSGAGAGPGEPWAPPRSRTPRVRGSTEQGPAPDHRQAPSSRRTVPGWRGARSRN